MHRTDRVADSSRSAGRAAAAVVDARAGTAARTRSPAAPRTPTAAGRGSPSAAARSTTRRGGRRPAPPCRDGAGRRAASPTAAARRPGRRTSPTVRSHTAPARSRSWVMNSNARPRSRRSSSRIAITSACVVTSSAVVGSSASSSVGSVSSAVAIITRCSRPPDSSCGYCRRRRSPSGTPTSASSLTDRALGLVVGDAVVGPQRLGHEVADPAHRVDVRARVLEDDPRCRRAAPAGGGPRRRARRVPSKRIAPSVSARFGSRRATARAVIDLPAPDSPTRPTASPGVEWPARRRAAPCAAALRWAAGRSAGRSRAGPTLTRQASERGRRSRECRTRAGPARARRRRGTPSRRRTCDRRSGCRSARRCRAKPDGTASTGQRLMTLNGAAS